MTRRRAPFAVLVVAATVALVATAFAKPVSELNARVTPSKGGTKKRPKNARLSITVANRTDTAGEQPPTTTKLQVFLPSEFVFGGAAFASCTFANANNSTDKCSAKARTGRGRAVFTAGSFTEQTLVTVYNGPKGKSLILRLDSQSTAPIPFHQALEGKLVKAGQAGFGQKLVIAVPEELQEAGGLRISMTDLQLLVSRTVKKRRRTIPYIGLGPCRDELLAFKTITSYRGDSEPRIATDDVHCS